MGANLAAPRLSSSAKADDPVIAGREEMHGSASKPAFTCYWMPAFAGMTVERLLKLALMGSSLGQAFSGSCSGADLRHPAPQPGPRPYAERPQQRCDGQGGKNGGDRPAEEGQDAAVRLDQRGHEGLLHHSAHDDAQHHRRDRIAVA